MRQVIDHFKVQAASEDIETQVQCPFHGHDTHASARIYASNSMYCWVCEKSWDVTFFVKDKNEVTYSQALEYLEKTFRIPGLDREKIFEESRKDLSDITPKKDPKPVVEEASKIFNNLFKILISNKEKFSLPGYLDIFKRYDDFLYKYKKQNNLILEDLKDLYNDVKKVI